jgi:polygalacturonase
MPLLTTVLGVVVLVCAAGTIPAVAADYSTTPEAHGAKGDGTTNDWAAIVAAVDSCAAYPACTVVFTKE